MAVGLTPDSWALLALCGVALSLTTSLLAIEPGLILMPLLAILLPRMGVPAGSSMHIAAATAIALLVPLSIARLGLLRRAECQQIIRLAPAVLAGAFFGGSLLPLIAGPLLLAGFAVVAAIALMRRPRVITTKFAVTPPSRDSGPFITILKSTASSLFGIGLPLSEGRTAERAVLTLILGTGAAAALFQAPSACKGCVGLVFMPALIAMAAGAVLAAPLWEALFSEPARPRLRPAAVFAAVTALLAAPFEAPGTGKTALAALAPGLCRARPLPAFTSDPPYRDPIPVLAQRFGPRRGFSEVKAGRFVLPAFLGVAREIAASSQVPKSSGWTAVIEIHLAKPGERSAKHSTSLKIP